MATQRAALFDIDGTLVDTNHLHVVTWWEAFRQAGHHVPMRDIHRAVGLSGGDLLDHLLGDDHDPDQDDQDHQLTVAHHTPYATYSSPPWWRRRDRLLAIDRQQTSCGVPTHQLAPPRHCGCDRRSPASGG